MLEESLAVTKESLVRENSRMAVLQKQFTSEVSKNKVLQEWQEQHTVEHQEKMHELATAHTYSDRLQVELDERIRLEGLEVQQARAKKRQLEEEVQSSQDQMARMKQESLQLQDQMQNAMRDTLRETDQEREDIVQSLRAQMATEEEQARAVAVALEEQEREHARFVAQVDYERRKTQDEERVERAKQEATVDALNEEFRHALGRHEQTIGKLNARITSQDNQLREAMQRLDQERRAAVSAASAASLVNVSQPMSQVASTPMSARGGAPGGGPGGGTVPRARVRIHRSGSIVIDNDQPMNASGMVVPPTPGGVVGQGYATSQSLDTMVDLLTKAEEARDALAKEVEGLRARLDLRESMGESTFSSSSSSSSSSSTSLVAVAASPNADRLHRMQEKVKRIQSEAEQTTVKARQQVESVEQAVASLRAALQSKTDENDVLRTDIDLLRAQIIASEENVKQERQNKQDKELHLVKSKLNDMNTSLSHAQHGQATAQSQLEQATKSVRGDRGWLVIGGGW